MASFGDARVVRLRSHRGKYLIAKEDRKGVCQDRDGSAECAKWTIEPTSNNKIRLKSCYDRYLTASTEKFFAGGFGNRVIQSLPINLDSSVEWEPVRDGEAVKLQTESGTFLRANRGQGPYKNSVTHDIPYRFSSTEYICWLVETVESTSQPDDLR